MAKDVKGKTSVVKANKKETAVSADLKPAEVTPAEIKPSVV